MYVLQIALPATALCMTYAYDDIDGRNSFYKAFAATSAATLILKRITKCSEWRHSHFELYVTLIGDLTQ